MKVRLNLVILLFLLISGFVKSEETLVIGNVRNKADKSPIQSVNIYFKDSNIGTVSDEDGFYVIKHTGQESTLVFSCMGYKTREFKIKPGETTGLYVEMREDMNLLQELFVMPGKNPALDLMERVRKAKYKNDVYNAPFSFYIENQQVILLSGEKSKHRTLRYFDSHLQDLDSAREARISFPLYLSDEQLIKTGNATPKTIQKTSKASPEKFDLMFEQLTGGLAGDLNFYHNTVILFGKHFISPLANASGAYYRFFLIDSINAGTGKQYYLRYRSRNNKNLAFNGELWIDSATCAMTKIVAELPRSANLNYIENLKLSGDYQQDDNGFWVPENTTVSLNMTYQLLADSANLSPEIYIEKRELVSIHEGLTDTDADFAGSSYTKEELEIKLAEMNDLPLMKTAGWIADGVLTGYVQAGKIDIGKLYQLARLSDIEGFRFSIPLRTNEHLWKNIEVGGYWGFGLRDKKHKYAVFASCRLPFRKKTVISGGYTDDLRRTNYDYYDFLLRENPLLSGDEDISNTLFSLRSSDRINPRKEWHFSLTHDWNNDIESKLIFRQHQYFGNDALPFIKDDVTFSTMTHHSAALITRFSFDEKSFEDHLTRIYIRGNRPVIYFHTEAGKVNFNQSEYPYGKIGATINHRYRFDIGEWDYSIYAGATIGKLPYNLLYIPQGSKSFYFNRYGYNLINYMEFALDKYVSMHHEWMFNGILLNHIPLIRLLNLRELVSFKFLYGGTADIHKEILDFRDKTGTLKYPYMEVGIGLTNILRIFSVQSVWRLSDTNNPDVRNWSILAGVRFNF
ncbi:MAG: DUF5686 family protein [Paludibacter sp.]|jgi:hypothetical protein|nr:carboxypeptidase-like regulatory domain-containing protein [Bacteroidales bacterium]